MRGFRNPALSTHINEAGIDKKLAKRARKAAALPKDEFEVWRLNGEGHISRGC
jgi:hypothetical protein